MSAGRAVWVKVRASGAERAELHAQASSAGLTLSDLWRPGFGQAMACRPDMPPCVVQWYRYDRLGFRFRTPRACSVLETDCSESASRFATSAMLPLSS